METRQANFTLPADLLQELRARVPRGKQSSVVAQALRAELKRRKFLEALDKAAGAWKDSDHPELADGVDQYIRRSRHSKRRIR